MTALAASSAAPRRRRALALPVRTVEVAAVVAVLGRLPSVGRAPGPDEAGLLLVGAQWDGRGSSLYGSYWVDRPPLLITIFRGASLLGGMPVVRAIGCLAVLAVVLGCARVAAMVRDEDAARWAALAAAALCLTPDLGAHEVNGELLAAPFVLAGMVAVVSAVQSTHQATAVRWAATGGAAAACALLVKQNLADVVVFGVVAYALAWSRHDIGRRRAVDLLGASVAGVAAMVLVVAMWTVAHGTSLHGVFEAMYPFRLRADQAISAGGGGHATARLHGLGRAALVSGLAAMVVVAAVHPAVRRARSPFGWALLATAAFAVASALLGGSYWHHYLVELVAPASVGVGLLAGRGARLARVVVAYAVLSALTLWCVGLTHPQGDSGQAVGRAVAAVAAPHDTLVTMWGRPDILATSGLRSPYEQLWSLPVKILDPRLSRLDGVLTGASAPTWLVTGPTVRSWGLQTTRTRAIIDRDYRHVRTICGRRIYLHDGIVRRPPPRPPDCTGTPSFAARVQEIAP